MAVACVIGMVLTRGSFFTVAAAAVLEPVGIQFSPLNCTLLLARSHPLARADSWRCSCCDTVQVTAECCDEPTEDCSNGYPASCNADCAKVRPFRSSMAPSGL